MRYLVRIEERTFAVGVAEKGGVLQISLNRREYQAQLLGVSEPRYSILLGNTVIELESEKKGEGYQVLWKGRKFTAQVEDERMAQIVRETPVLATALKELKSPLPGVVVKIEVHEEEQVQAGQGVLILEAMKMENEIKSPFTGRIKEILVRERQTVEKDQALVVFA